MANATSTMTPRQGILHGALIIILTTAAIELSTDDHLTAWTILADLLLAVYIALALHQAHRR